MQCPPIWYLYWRFIFGEFRPSAAINCPNGALSGKLIACRLRK
jgi:hypothetical protein